MRPSCLDCARKHLAQACILATEAVTGYPSFVWLVIGHMAEAEAELVEKYPTVANTIREHRKEYEQDNTLIIPFMDLIELLTDLESDDMSNA